MREEYIEEDAGETERERWMTERERWMDEGTRGEERVGRGLAPTVCISILKNNVPRA